MEALVQPCHLHSDLLCDSNLGVGQANGTLGTACPDNSYRLLRGLDQTLEVALTSERFLVQHVRAHAGDLFNEIADTAARQEALKTTNLPRQRIDING